jgi:hypothetical protein
LCHHNLEIGSSMKFLKEIFIFTTFSLTLGTFAHSDAPRGYDDLSACKKQDVLWNHIKATTHQELPKLHKFGFPQLFGMTVQELSVKKDRHSDFAPKKWKKFLHRRGAMAKVKITPTSQNKYTGIFSGADCALVRLSLTYRPKGKRDVAPGLALKVLRQGASSANLSALYTLEGQKKDFNFFKNPLSNIVPMGDSLGLKVVHSLFKKVSGYPEEIVLNHMAATREIGKKESDPKAPRHIFFVPNEKLSFSSSKHDVRNDFLSIPTGTLLYSIYAVNEDKNDFNYINYEKSDIPDFVDNASKVGEIHTTSEFVASEFGDTGIFFRHELRSK